MLKNDKILVLIQLIGGNDCLSTTVPLESYDDLAAHRQNILVPEKQLLKTGELGFHPAIAQLFHLYNNGEACIVNQVGYPVPNRSHFRSMDIWNSGSPSNEQWNTGWLGRFLDLYHADFPSGYPNLTSPDPLAITVGNVVSDTCQGKYHNYSHVVNDLSKFAEIDKCSIGTLTNPQYSQMMQYLNSTITLANAYTHRVEAASAKGRSQGSYPSNNTLARELKIVSQLISGGLQTQIYCLSMNGFDTHAYQTAKDNPAEGTHAMFLNSLSEAIGAFVADLKAQACYERVCIATYSEFGRQIKSNSAFGTDHGDAGSVMLFGPQLKNQLLGEIPRIGKNVDKQQGLDMEIDFRDLYASLLSQWLAVPQDKMTELFKTNTRNYEIFNTGRY